jgi:hypothetical protein
MDPEEYLELILTNFMADYDILGTKKKVASGKQLDLNKVSLKL